MKYLRACCIVLLAVQFWTGTVQASDDDNRLSNIVDAAGMFNERGYSKANSFSLSGNEVINDFNGNLMYTQRLLYLPISENGLHCDIKLTYNGNVSHTAFGARSGMNGIMQTPINLPEWILSVNGIGVQTFNFENELVSWRSSLQGDTISYDDDVAAHIEGYHKCYRETADGFHGIISILMEDGSVREFYSVSDNITGPAYMIGGEYNSCSKDDPDRGYLWPIASPKYGEFTLFRSDGTQVDFEVYQPKYRSDVNCSGAFPSSRNDYPRILIPQRFRDHMGHTISLTYFYVMEEDSVWGRPILAAVGDVGFGWSTWEPGITSSSNEVEITLHGNRIYRISFAGIPPEPGVISSKAVSWKYDACRGMVYSIDNSRQEPTIFTYRTYARAYNDLKMGPQFEYDICGPVPSRYAGRAYRVSPWRIWKIQYPHGGRQYVQYYMDEATAWGQYGNLGAADNLSIDYDHSENCMTNQVPRFPCKKSEAFDLIGRDPFFLNIVAATRRTLDGIKVVNTDSLKFSWLDETDDEVIGSDDKFFTTRWFGRETATDRENGDQVKERILTYQYFPEKGTFSSRSRDRGWVMKMESSIERNFGYPTNQVRKDYYWDTDCSGLICYGTLLLDSLRTTHDSESYTERFQYYWLGDPGLDTVNILTQKDVIDPWGIKTVTLFNTSHCSLGDPATAYFNNGLVSDVRVRRTSDNALLKHQSYQYHTGPYTGGFAGQLQSSTSFLLDDSGTPTQSIVDRFQYNTGVTLGQHRGSTQWHIDPEGDTTSYYYALSNEAVTYHEQDYEGTVRTKTTTFDYSDSGPFWFKKTNRCGSRTFTTYQEVDERGRLLWLVEPNGFRSELTYDDLNRVHKVILPGGYKPSSRDAQLPPGPQDTAWSIWNFYDDEYNEFVPDPVSIKQLTRVDHGRPSITGRVWIDGLSRAYRHDALNADGSCDSVVVDFDFAGRTVSETDQLDFVTTTDYDYLDRAVKTRYPDLSHSSDSVKYTITNADAVGLTSRFSFPETIIYKHESRDENGHIVNEYYDVRNKLRLRQTYDGQTPLSTYFDYGDLGNLTLIIKPKGDSVRYTYNSLGQLTSERESDFESWTAAILNEYDKNGNLVSRQDPNLFYCGMPPCPIVKWQRFVYDKMDRPVQTAVETSADKGPIHFYDITGRYFYDQSNCELSKGRLSLEIAYDTLGRCDYAKRYDYDPRGRVKKQVNHFNATLDSTLIAGSGWEFHAHGDSVVIQYTYDWADQLKSITYPDGSVVKYDYDERGRLISVGGAPPNEIDRYARLDYTKRNQLETMVLGAGLQQMDYAYNERGWLLSINDGTSNLNAPADMFGQSLYYDSHGGTAYIGSPQYNGNLFGQKISIRRTDEFFSYRYDESDRLKESFIKPQFSSPMQFDEISYDANGNITRQSFGDGLVKNYHYHSNTNKLTIVDHEQVRPDDTLSYDAMGNVTTHSGKRASMIYDQANQLVMVIVKTGIGADTIRYAYDTSGNRIYKAYTYHWQHRCDQQTKAAGGGGEFEEEDPRFPPADTASLYCISSDTKCTYYVLDQGGRVLAEQSGPSPSSATAKFIYAGSQRIGMRDATNKLHYFLNDHLGSTRLVIDSTGAQRDVHRYYSFGKTYAEATNTNQSYRYTGKPLDKEAGLNLYYYGARYYDPELGRFLAIDPAASKYPGLSPYAYCANNPVKNVDPDGAEPITVAAASGSVLYVGGVVVIAVAAAVATEVQHPGTIKSFGDVIESAFDNAKADVSSLIKSIGDLFSESGDGETNSAPEDASPAVEKTTEPKGGTYNLTVPKSGEKTYTGRSSDLKRREGEHARDPEKGKYDFEVDKRTDSKAAQRGREQMNYDKYKPPLNKNRPIDKKNPNYEDYMREGRNLE